MSSTAKVIPFAIQPIPCCCRPTLRRNPATILESSSRAADQRPCHLKKRPGVAGMDRSLTASASCGRSPATKTHHHSEDALGVVVRVFCLGRRCCFCCSLFCALLAFQLFEVFTAFFAHCFNLLLSLIHRAQSVEFFPPGPNLDHTPGHGDQWDGQDRTDNSRQHRT